MPADVVSAARRFRYDARQRGNDARKLLARHYAATAAGVRSDVRAMEAAATRAHRNGVTLTPEFLASLAEHRATLVKVRGRLLKAADSTFELADSEVRREVVYALKDARTMTADITLDTAERIDETAVLNLIGVGDRGPVRQLLEQRAGADADAVMDLLVNGLVRDRPAAQTAAAVQQHLVGSSYAAALRLVRTETHRARREASRVVYLHTSGIRGWIWVCSLTPSSCGLCWAQHGTIHPLDEPMTTHPNCTCECAPWDGHERPDTGVELFEALTPAEQDEALGTATARAYRDGAISLPDLIAQRRSAVWGPVGTQASLLSVLGPADAGRYYRAG